MTIELNLEDLAEIQEQAAHYGACVLKTKTTEGDDVWLAVQTNRKAPRKRTATNADASAATQ